MADGLGGIYTVVAPIRDAVAAGTLPPILVVALDPNPNPQSRAAEYLRGWTGGSDDYALHERWFLEQVIPWAERTQRAARARDQRFIGGFSNGADFALAIASTHSNMFAGALIHSPVGARASWVNEQAVTQRWVVTGGTREQGGGTERPGQLPRDISQALERAHAPLRTCIGPWGHNGRSWRDVTPGSLVWLMNLGDPAALATERERDSCRETS
jgi:predicted esterase